MAYQFIHIEAYAREIKKELEVKAEENASKKKKQKKSRTVREIIAEAKREDDNCPHIDIEKLANPALAPEKIYGLNLDAVEKEANFWAENSKDGGGQKLRKNGMCLLAGVVSLPNDTTPEDWQSFKNSAVNWLKKEYGKCLRSVIEHKDEAHKHLHFYCIPDAGKQFSSIHKGIEARTKARQEKLSSKEQNLAYCEAMREFQDKFSLEVGQPHGLTRIGPGRRRLTRAQWQQEQAQARALKQANSRAKKVVKKAEKQAIEIVEKAEEKASNINAFGVSVGGFFDGLKNGYSKSKKELEEKIDEVREEERAKHLKELNEQRKHFEYEIDQSESARDDLKLTNKELRTELKNIYSKHGEYIKEQKALEEKEKLSREIEARRQQREQEEQEQRQRQNKDQGIKSVFN